QGTYTFQWGVWDEGVGWVPDFIPAITVEVGPPCVANTSCSAEGRSCGGLWDGCHWLICGSNSGYCGVGENCNWQAGTCAAPFGALYQGCFTDDSDRVLPNLVKQPW